jgi:hypothetical protein
LKGDLPIIGLDQPEVTSFGEAHTILLQNIPLKQVISEKEAFSTSFSIIQTCYKHFQPEIWNKLTNFNHGSTPEKSLLNIVLSRAISEDLMVDQTSDGFHQSYKLDELKIPKIEMFPKSMKPRRFFARKGTFFSKEESDIEKDFNKYPFNKLENSRWFTKIEDPPIDFCEKVVVENDIIYHHYQNRVSVLIRDYYLHVTSKLRFLLINLRICHKQLISLQTSNGKVLFLDAISQFLKWFCNILFTSEENHRAIFGDFRLKESENPPSNVGLVQRYLIKEYLNPNDSYEKAVQVSLALLCYWYQKFHPHSFFESKREYWKEMIESLGLMLDVSGSYSVSRFDKEGNLTGK